MTSATSLQCRSERTAGCEPLHDFNLGHAPPAEHEQQHLLLATTAPGQV